MQENYQYTIKRCRQIERDIENLIILRRNLDKAILRIELTDMCDDSTYFTFGNPYFCDELKQRLLASMVDAAMDQLMKEYKSLMSILE